MEKRDDWRDGECFYVSCIDGPQFALLAGPFQTHEEALSWVDRANDEAQKYGDPKAWFYAYGTCKMAHGHKKGLLNFHLGI
jgi:hypothetical protein